MVLLTGLGLAGCGKKPPSPEATAVEPATLPAVPRGNAEQLARQLAVARADSARLRWLDHAQDEALAWAAAALEADPASPEAAVVVRELLAGTRWPVALWELKHQLPVSQVALSGPATLWVALASDDPATDCNTLVRWDTAAMRIEAVMFPSTDSTSRCLLAAAGGRALVVGRGAGESRVQLLCDGETLRPVAELQALPDDLTPEAVVAFSASGLLMAHPEPQAGDPTRLVWRIRDTATGGVVRSVDPVGPEVARPVAAWLDDHRLLVLLKDSSLAVVPVSPVEPVTHHRPKTPATVLQARFSDDGSRILGLWDQGDGRAPRRGSARFTLPENAVAPQVEWHRDTAPLPASWWQSPFCRQTSWWDSLLRDHGLADDPPATRISGNDLLFSDASRAPIRSGGKLTAAAFADDAVVTATADGRVRLHHWLPPATLREPASPDAAPDLAIIRALAVYLSGLRFDPTQGKPAAVSDLQRLEAFALLTSSRAVDPIPGLDLGGLLDAARKSRPRSVPAAAWQPLWDRLAQADASGRSWSRWLRLGQDLGDSRWHQDLTEALALRADPQASPTLSPTGGTPSPWLAQREIRALMQQADDPALQAALERSGGKGPALTSALALALDGERPDRIEQCLASARDLPPFLNALARSRIAWLEKRPADALSLWPDEFPEFPRVRATQDWQGWEQEDFEPRYQRHLSELRSALGAYEIPAATTAAEREWRALALLEPTSRATLGRRRLADLCLKGAQHLAEHDGKPELIQQLAGRARDLGAPAVPALRVEALAETLLGRHPQALALWVKLLTENPVEEQQADDYTAAAHCAFEAAEPGRAIDILTTGINRFGNDPGFALRAGWIALLTGSHSRAYQFLLAGFRVGFDPEEEENACLLLAVAASLAGFPQDAASHYLRLIDLEPEWLEPETADSLDWPEDLKNTIRQLIGGPDIMLPETDGFSTDPTLEPLPDE